MVEKIQNLDTCLSIRGEHLFVEGCDTFSLVKQYGSPIFVFSENQLRQNVREFISSFSAGWPNGPIKLLPAAKANWIAAIQRILVSEGCGCDVYSPGELSVALKAGIEPQYISVNGSPKDFEHVKHAISVGARITIDSTEETEMIQAAVQELGCTAKVRLRIKPILANFTENSDFVAEGLVPADIAALTYKGGLTYEQLLPIAKKLQDVPGVEVVGFHQHHGRHDPSLRYWQQQMREYAREIGRVCAALGGLKPKEIDIGGGFAIPRDPFNAATDYTAPFQFSALFLFSKLLKLFGNSFRYRTIDKLVNFFVSEPNKNLAPSIADYAQVCTRTLREELQKNRIDTQGVMLQIEPGRSLHGNSGIHLTTVKAIKKIEKPIRWQTVIVDTTEFWFTGGRYEHHLHDYVVANKATVPQTSKADIIGRSCYGDRILPLVKIPELAVGDVIALLDTGAYQEMSMSNFNALPRPGSVLVCGNQVDIIRKPEAAADVFCRDVIPERFQ